MNKTNLISEPIYPSMLCRTYQIIDDFINGFHGDVNIMDIIGFHALLPKKDSN